MESYTILKKCGRVPVLANIPHSSTFIPEEIRRSFLISDGQLERELLLLTDRFVDELFSEVYEMGGVLVKYNYSRMVVDPERFENDEDEEMAKKGMGAIYTRTSAGRTLRASPDRKEREELLERFYRPYHRAMEQEVEELLGEFGRCLILDCHSFPSVPLPFEPDQDPERPGICLGTDAFHTPAVLGGATAEEYFKNRGLRVALNKPYAGTYVPLRYLGKDSRVFSMMIELNRNLYMDEKTSQKPSSFQSMRKVVGGFVHSTWIPTLVF